MRDRSVGAVVNRGSDANPTQGVWHHYVMTCDGTGGATAADGITFYEDGAVFDSTAANNGSYVGMENQSAVLGLGAYQTGRSAYSLVRWRAGRSVPSSHRLSSPPAM